MPDLIDLIARWWKKIVFITIMALLIAGVILFLKPVKYLSTATAVPASSFANDRASVYNNNIQQLYSALGTPDDLDAVTGLGALDTLYLSVSDKLNLPEHYAVKEKGAEARTKAAYLLKKNTKIYKSEYGNLKVKVWDKDKWMASKMANQLMEQLQWMFQEIQSAGNKAVLEALIKKRNEKQNDSLSKSHSSISDTQQATNEKLINEYQLMVDNKPPALIIVENARPAAWPDKPRKLQLLTATAVLSFLFGLLAALVLDRKKIQPH